MNLSTLCVSAALVAHAAALHMYIGGRDEPRCFYLDLSRGDLLAERHSAWELEEGTNKWVRDNTLSIEVSIDEVFDNGHRVYHQKHAPFGQYQFNAQDGGEHRICYRALTQGWWSKNKVKLEIDYQIGSDALLDTKGEQKLGGLADRISELNRKLVHVRREQAAMREREASFRDLSERTNASVARLTIFQLVVLMCTCAWQITNLRSFFTKQKLV